MGVYNPQAELPRSCVVCDYRYSCPLSSQNVYGLSSFKHKDCPLVEVPTPHGRLIDADELCLTGWWIKSTPTIIEAEGKNDE